MNNDHEMRSECASKFGEISAQIASLGANDTISREDFKELRNLLLAIRDDVAALKVKASVWGGVTGLVAGLAAALATMLGR